MRGAVACALLVLLAGCGGGPVDVAGPAPSAADAEACAPFLDALPDEVAGEERREVDPGDRSFAAWGDPAIVLACGVPMPSGYQPGATCMRADDVDWYIPDTQLDDEDERAASLGYPLFAKPARGGSSIGISKVHDAGELDGAMAEALRYDPKVLLEAYAEGGREVECGVLQALDGSAETSVAAEIRISGEHEFYDFAAKYLPEEHTELDVPADLPADVTAQVQDMSVRAFEAVGGEGLARVDFFVLPDGGVVVNEINTMPGFTPTSMYPRMWAASGVDYPALVDRLIRLALARGTGLR